MGCGASETLNYVSAEDCGRPETRTEIQFTRYFSSDADAHTDNLLHKIVLKALGLLIPPENCTTATALSEYLKLIILSLQQITNV